MNNSMNTKSNIWGTLAVDTISIAYAVSTGDMVGALSMATGAAVVEDAEKQFSGDQFNDSEWAKI